MTTTGGWALPIAHTHHTAASAAHLSFVGGAGDLDAAGVIRHPDDLDSQIGGALDNLAWALSQESCTLADVVRIKAFYTAAEDADDWGIIAALAKAFPDEPMPVISTLAVPLQPFAGQCIQLQAIAQRGWRGFDDVRVATRPVPAHARDMFGGRSVTGGLRAGEFIAVANRAALDAEGTVLHPGDCIAQSHAIMAIHEATLAELGASFQDSVKMEGYYLDTMSETWADTAKVRTSYFRDPGPPATVVPCHRLAPEGLLTKVEVLGMRENWNGFDKYIPRQDHWPKRVWDWSIPLTYRQGVGLRDTIWLGGQVAAVPGGNSGRLYDGGLLPQTRVTMTYIEDLLRPFGRRPADLKMMVCYFTSSGDQAETEAFVGTIADCVGGALPPMTLVPKPQMQTPRLLVEIWGIAQG